MTHSLLFGGEVVIVQLAASNQVRDSLVYRDAVCTQPSNLQRVIGHEADLVNSDAGEHLSAE